MRRLGGKRSYLAVTRLMAWFIFCLLFECGAAGVCGAELPATGADVEASIPIVSSIANGKFDEVRNKIIEMVAARDVPSISVAVARGSEVVWEESFGWADMERDVAANPQTMYSLASITKPMTATGLMVLVERGKVRLDDRVNDYIDPAELTSFTGDASKATVEHLLNHTSGLPTHYSFFYSDEPYTRPPMAESIRRYGILVHRPGEVYEYSNFGYGIIGYIIANVADKSFSDFMKDEVFEPLGLTRTFIGTPSGVDQNVAIRYDEGAPLPDYGFDHDGASAAYSSAHDLVRFGMFHLKIHGAFDHPVLTDESIERMQHIDDKSAANWTPETQRGYALGWFIRENNYGFYRVSHHGGMPGAATLLFMLPTEEISIVILANGVDRRVYGLYYDIAAAMLPVFKRNMEADVEGDEPEERAFVPSANLVGTWEGFIHTYDGKSAVAMTVQPDGDVHFRQHELHETLLNDVVFEDGMLTATCFGVIATEDAHRHNHDLLLKVRLKGNQAAGFVLARAHGARVYYGLPSYISMTRDPDHVIR